MKIGHIKIWGLAGLSVLL